MLVVLFWRVPESRDPDASGRLDWWGTLLGTLGLGALVYGLIEAGSLGFGTPLVPSALALGLVALLAFLLVEARRPAPIVPLTLFRSPTFSGANLLTLLLYGALSGVTFFLPFDLIQVQGYAPTLAGTAFVPFILLKFLLSRYSSVQITVVFSTQLYTKISVLRYRIIKFTQGVLNETGNAFQ